MKFSIYFSIHAYFNWNKILISKLFRLNKFSSIYFFWLIFALYLATLILMPAYSALTFNLFFKMKCINIIDLNVDIIFRIYLFLKSRDQFSLLWKLYTWRSTKHSTMLMPELLAKLRVIKDNNIIMNIGDFSSDYEYKYDCDYIDDFMIFFR